MDRLKAEYCINWTRKGKFEHSHTALDNLQKGFPPDIKGKTKEMTEELVKESILHLKKTSYGKQVSINVEKKEEVMKYIDEFLKME